MATRRLGIIGLGMAVAPHARSLSDLRERVEVAAAFSPSEKRRSEFSAKYSFPVVDDAERIFGDAAIDAVLILTPPNTHLDLVRRAAAAGKHILLEKPLEVTTERAVTLVETARRANVSLAVMLQHRFRPAAIALTAAIEAGEMGTIVGCSASIRLWRPQSYYDQPGRGTKARDGGGVLMTQGIHTLDLMLSLAGAVKDVRGFAATTPVHRMETEDMVCAAVTFNNGAIGVIEATTTAFPGFPERIVMTGSKATAVLAGTQLTIHHHDGRTTEIKPDASSGGTGADPMAFPHDYHRALIADFLDSLDENRAPKVSGAEALKVHRLIDALLAAAAKP